MPSGIGTITDLDVDLDISHTWVGDLDIDLTHLSTSNVRNLIDRPGVPASTFGCSANNILATVDDEAAAAAETMCNGTPPAIGGAVIGGDPADASLLANYDGEDVAGPWRLDVADEAVADVGTLNGWCLNVQYTPANQAPVCSAAYPDQTTLWPPNHKFQAIQVLGVTDPDGDPVTIAIASIFQDEVVNSNSPAPDGQGVGTSTASVRAERDGGGNGRFYHIGFTASDGQGGSCTGTVRVVVPKSQGKSDSPVDGGALYDSTIP